jgi:hypothetical protein
MNKEKNPMKQMTVLALSLAVGLFMLAPIPSAFAHTGCEADLKELGQTIRGIEFTLEHELKKRSGGGSHQRMHRKRARRLEMQLNGALEHLQEAKTMGCPDTGDALRNRIRQLEHQVEHLTK